VVKANVVLGFFAATVLASHGLASPGGEMSEPPADLGASESPPDSAGRDAGALEKAPVVALDDLAQHVGERVTVEDMVKAVSSSPRSGTIYVNFGDAYPRQKLSLKIAKEHEDLGKSAYRLWGLQVRVTGVVESGKDGPSMAITSAGQVEVVKDDSIDLLAVARGEPGFPERTPPGPYDHVPPDGDTFGALLGWKLEKLFREGRYEELEEVAAAWRKPEARMLDGRWHLFVFYNVFGISSRASEEAFAEWRRKLEDWRTARPEAIEPVILLASLECSYAWRARGNGWAHTVTKEGWRLMAERLEKAKALLDSIYERRLECPEWTNSMQSVALGQGWPDRKVKAMVAEATAAWPEYWPLYFAQAHRLLPRWGGAPGEWEAYSRSFPGDLGKELSVRIPWAQSWPFSNMFKEADIPWSQMRDGFEFLVRRYPKSARTKSAYARYAAIAEDKETCQRLLDELGDDVSMEFFMSWQNVDIIRQWIASSGQPPPFFLTPQKAEGK
jgi:hypothetical protein